MRVGIRLNRLLNSLKISRQLYMVYFLAGLFPILLVGGYLIANTRHLLLSHYHEQIETDNLRVRNILLDVTTILNNITDDFFTDEQLQGLLTERYATLEDSYAACRAYTKMNHYSNNFTEISKLTLYVNNTTISDYGHFQRTTKEIREQDWYKRAADSLGSYLWMTVEQTVRGGTRRTELTLIRKIPLFGTQDYAVLVIGVNDNFLKSRIQTNALQTELWVADSPVFYTAVRENNGKMPNIDLDYSSDYFRFAGVTEYNATEQLLAISTLKPIKGHDTIYIMTVDSNALPFANQITLICAGIVIFSLFITIFMVAAFTRIFSSRVNVLRKEMHKVSRGDFNITDDLNGNDELMELFTDLKAMIESIKQMDAEIYNARISQQKLINHQQEIQFQVLTSQINPHFLYNTLETIRMKAHSVGNREVADAIKLLGKSMRHVLEMGGRPVTLRSELEYIEVYLKIQKLRFADRLNYEILVDENIHPESHRILPLLLQPIVENALIHGLEYSESTGIVTIQILRNGERLEVSVSDNGAGIEESEQERIIAKIRNEHAPQGGGGIGLANIHQRILLYYGEDYGIEIQSTAGQGTRVTAVLPYRFTCLDNTESLPEDNPEPPLLPVLLKGKESAP